MIMILNSVPSPCVVASCNGRALQYAPVGNAACPRCGIAIFSAHRAENCTASLKTPRFICHRQRFGVFPDGPQGRTKYDAKRHTKYGPFFDIPCAEPKMRCRGAHCASSPRVSLRASERFHWRGISAAALSSEQPPAGRLLASRNPYSPRFARDQPSSGASRHLPPGESFIWCAELNRALQNQNRKTKCFT